jgi:hypothetical protein
LSTIGQWGAAGCLMLGYQKSAAGPTPLTFGLLWKTFDTSRAWGFEFNTAA